MGADPRRRLAIVGLGPKGLYALERLITLFEATTMGCSPPLEVVCFEPLPTPGAGPNYDPDQPEYLRLNFPADRVDMWQRDLSPPSIDHLDFPSWWRERNPDGDLQRYPPRAAVGRYLAWGLQRLVDNCPVGMTVTVQRTTVGPIRRTLDARGDRSWELRDHVDRVVGHFDEVLLTVGHLDRGPDSLAAGWRGQAALIPRVFPVTRFMSTSRIPPGDVVAIRGFALTCVDAVLALTEGRGGRFAAEEHPWMLTYHRSLGALEPAVILPFSRTGAALAAKPESHPHLPTLTEELAADWQDRVLSVPGALMVQDQLLPILADVGVELLELAGAGTVPAERILVPLQEMCERGRQRPPGSDQTHLIQESLDVATGLRSPGLDWALGEAWRRLYPAIVVRCGGNGIDEAAWPDFRRLAAGMERLAFGAPAVNMAKMLALVDAGLLRLDMVAGTLADVHGQGSKLTSGDCSVAVGAVVDAVLPPPGVAGLTSPPITSLMIAGHLRRPVGRRGVEIRADATAVGEDGRPRPTLAVLGRPTEDWVIGNDTLSRTLHPHPEAWARGVLDRLTATTSRAAE